MTSKTNEKLVNCVIIFTVIVQFSSNFSWQVTEQLSPTNITKPGKRTTNYLYPFCRSVISFIFPGANMMIFVIVIFVAIGWVHLSWIMCNAIRTHPTLQLSIMIILYYFVRKGSNHKLTTSIFISHVNTTRKTTKLLVCLLLYLHKIYLTRTF